MRDAFFGGRGRHGVKRMRGVAVTLACLAVCGLPVPAFADIDVVISKSQQEMLVALDGVPTYRWTVSTGRQGYATPSGNFRAIRLERVYFSKKYDDAPMPNAVFFHGGYAIHGTYEERWLGRAVSHGCVRLSRAHAAILFEAVRREGLNRTHIVVTDAPLFGDAPVARLDRPRFGGAFVDRDGDALLNGDDDDDVAQPPAFAFEPRYPSYVAGPQRYRQTGRDGDMRRAREPGFFGWFDPRER
jgi:hypothetical protein